MSNFWNSEHDQLTINLQRPPAPLDNCDNICTLSDRTRLIAMMRPEDDTLIMPPFQTEYWLEDPILALHVIPIKGHTNKKYNY